MKQIEINNIWAEVKFKCQAISKFCHNKNWTWQVYKYYYNNNIVKWMEKAYFDQRQRLFGTWVSG